MEKSRQELARAINCMRSALAVLVSIPLPEVVVWLLTAIDRAETELAALDAALVRHK